MTVPLRLAAYGDARTHAYSLQIIARLRAKLSEFKGRLREEERLSRSINERHGH